MLWQKRKKPQWYHDITLAVARNIAVSKNIAFDLCMRSANILNLPALCIKYIEVGDVGRIKNLSTSCREYENLNSVECN